MSNEQDVERANEGENDILEEIEQPERTNRQTNVLARVIFLIVVVSLNLISIGSAFAGLSPGGEDKPIITVALESSLGNSTIES